MSGQFKKSITAGLSIFGIYLLGFFILLLIRPDFNFFVYYLFGGAGLVTLLCSFIVVWSVWKFFTKSRHENGGKI